MAITAHSSRFRSNFSPVECFSTIIWKCFENGITCVASVTVHRKHMHRQMRALMALVPKSLSVVLIGVQEMLSPFRYGTAHKSKTRNRESKRERNQQHTRRHRRTKLISHFISCYTGPVSSVSGYGFLQRKDSRSTFQPQEKSCIWGGGQSLTPRLSNLLRTAGLCLFSEMTPHFAFVPQYHLVWFYIFNNGSGGAGVIRMDCIHLALVKASQEQHTWQAPALGLEFQRGQMWRASFVPVLISSHVCTAYDQGVSRGVKWMIVVPNLDLAQLFVPFS